MIDIAIPLIRNFGGCFRFLILHFTDFIVGHHLSVDQDEHFPFGGEARALEFMAELFPWRSVREQLWQNDSNEARLAAIMKRAIATLRAVWPELRAEVNPKHFGPDCKRAAGIVVGPPRDGLYMFSGVESARKQIAVVPPSKPSKKR